MVGTFYVILTLSSLVGPQALFFSQPPQPWKTEVACRRALPKMEDAVARLIRYDPSTVKLFGIVTGGPLNRSYFVSSSECHSAEPSP
jgi:hypothetical protein